MRIPVLVVLPAQDSLREAALEAIQHRPPESSLESATVPGGIELDSSFTPVAIGGAGGRESSLESLQPEESEQFVVRGFVETAARADVPAAVGGQRVFSDIPIQPFVTCGSDPPLGDVALVRQKLRLAELAARGLDGSDVAIAIVDNGIDLDHLTTKLGSTPRLDAANSWSAPTLVTPPGGHATDHGTMCAYDALIAAPAATLLDYPVLTSGGPGGSAASGTIGTALQAFSSLLTSWRVAYAPDGLWKYRGLVISNSWGIYDADWDFPPGHPGRYIDNPMHPFNQIVRVLASVGADIVFAAGNCGADCADARCRGRTRGTIMGANALPDVLTIAGCDTNGQRVGYSSQGPSIPGMYAEKPDLTTYTHFLGSETFGANTPDSGTSTACPVAAGCVAALRTRLPPDGKPPAQLFAQLRATATPAAGSAGWNTDYGHGLLDPLAAANALGL